MLQIEIFENRDRSPLLCGGFPVCQRYTRRQKSLLYSFPLSPSSSGQGRHPFKVDIAGSNPAGGTTKSEKPVTNSVAGFLLPMRRDSNPTGCGAEETRSVFQRSTQGAKRRSGARPPTRRTRNPSVPHQPRAPHVKQIEPTPPSGGIRTRKDAERRSGARPPQADAVSALRDVPKVPATAAGLGRTWR